MKNEQKGWKIFLKSRDFKARLIINLASKTGRTPKNCIGLGARCVM